MKYIEGAKPREFDLKFDSETSTYTYPCGCTFKVDPTRPAVNGHLPIIIDRKYNEQCPAVWDLFAEGLTTGVFQLESPLGKRYSAKLKPESIEHLAALVALLRPGVLKAKDENGVNMADVFCHRKNGIDPVNISIEAIKPILEPTYDVMLFQEQLLQIAACLADFDKVEADNLRSAVSKKKMDKITEIGKEFIDRCEKVGKITREEATTLFENIKKSGRYIFNRCLYKHEFIQRASKTQHATHSVAEMYRIRNDLEYAKASGHGPLHYKWKRLKCYGWGLSLDEDGRVRKNRIVDIQPAGVRLVYEVALKNGMKTRVTGNHKFPTTLGEKTVDEMLAYHDLSGSWSGLELPTRGEYDPSAKKYNWSHMTRAEMDARKESQSVNGRHGDLSHLFTNGSYTQFMNFKANTPDVCKRCGKDDCRIETHHINGDRTNSTPENLEKLCVSCHKKTEYANGRTRRGEKGYPVVYSEIESITPIGEDETYDVTMEAPRHTFVTGDGILTCNSHSVSYAKNAFETAYLKVHFPVYFFASYLEYAGEKMDPVKEVRKLIRDAKRFDVEVLTPRFVDLEPRFSTDNVKVRFGLTSIKGLGEKAVAKMRTSLDRDVLITWDWFKFLTQGSALCGIGHLRNIVMAGGMSDYPLARQRMLAELQAWNDLTEREQGEVVKLGDPLYKTVPDHEDEVRDVETPEYDKGEMKAYRAALKDYKRMCADILNNEEYQAESGEQHDLPDYPEEPVHPEPIGTVMKPKKVKVQVGEHEELVDRARPASNLEEALQGLLDCPGCLSKARRPKVESALSLLRRPAFPLVDEPYMIEKMETELLGVPITATIMSGVDASIADTTVLEYLEGKDERSMTIAGQVAEFFEREVRNGENRGRKMATLAFADDTGTLEDVIAFPDAWERNASLLMRPSAAVAIEGVRNHKDGKTFIINDVWSLS